MSLSIVDVLVERDGMSEEDARAELEEARQAVREGEDPQEVLEDFFGLELDYILELL